MFESLFLFPWWKFSALLHLKMILHFSILNQKKIMMGYLACFYCGVTNVFSLETLQMQTKAVLSVPFSINYFNMQAQWGMYYPSVRQELIRWSNRNQSSSSFITSSSSPESIHLPTGLTLATLTLYHIGMLDASLVSDAWYCLLYRCPTLSLPHGQAPLNYLPTFIPYVR